MTDNPTREDRMTSEVERVARARIKTWLELYEGVPDDCDAATFLADYGGTVGMSFTLGTLRAAISALNGESAEREREAEVVRDISGETVLGFRVAAYRETHPEHGDKYGHSYSEHWSTPSTRDPRVKVERLFTEDQLRAALTTTADTEQG